MSGSKALAPASKFASARSSVFGLCPQIQNGRSGTGTSLNMLRSSKCSSDGRRVRFRGGLALSNREFRENARCSRDRREDMTGVPEESERLVRRDPRTLDAVLRDLSAAAFVRDSP